MVGNENEGKKERDEPLKEKEKKQPIRKQKE